MGVAVARSGRVLAWGNMQNTSIPRQGGGEIVWNAPDLSASSEQRMQKTNNLTLVHATNVNSSAETLEDKPVKRSNNTPHSAASTPAYSQTCSLLEQSDSC